MPGMPTTTNQKDFLGRRLKNDVPGTTNATDYIGRAVQAGNKDYMGMALGGVSATGATAGLPGPYTPANAELPLNLADIQTGVTATPATAWTAGQYVPLADGTKAKWNSTAWVAA
jgi:hypothetical protein